MVIKEGICDEHWGLYISDASLNSNPETNIALYVTDLKFKLKNKFNLKIKIRGVWVAQCLSVCLWLRS